MSRVIHWENCFRVLSYFLCDLFWVEIQGVETDIGEYGSGVLIQNAVRRSGKGHGRSNGFITRFQSSSKSSSMKCRRTRAETHCVFSANPVRKGLFKFCN